MKKCIKITIVELIKTSHNFLLSPFKYKPVKKQNKMFIIQIDYKVSLDIVEQHLASHVDYLKQQYALGNFIASGRQVPRTGGVILSNMASRETLDLVIAQDPFKQNNLADYVITEFVPSMTCQELDFLRQ